MNDYYAFVLVERDGELKSIQPISRTGGYSLFYHGQVPPTEIDIYAVDSDTGTKILEKYRDGVLPADDISWEMIFDE